MGTHQIKLDQINRCIEKLHGPLIGFQWTFLLVTELEPSAPTLFTFLGLLVRALAIHYCDQGSIPAMAHVN